jgi:hypothetical protein
MNGLFCWTNAKNNEEYKKVIRFRMNIMVILGIIGIATFAVALLAEYKWKVSVSEHMLGVYSGAGTGLFAAAVALWIKNKLLLKNEEKLKESRLNNTDERIREISSKAFRTAAAILLIALYAFALIGGIFYPVLVQVLLSIACIFLVSYVIAFKIYEKKM